MTVAFKRKINATASKGGKQIYTDKELQDEIDAEKDDPHKIHMYQVKNFSRTFKKIKEEYLKEKSAKSVKKKKDSSSDLTQITFTETTSLVNQLKSSLNSGSTSTTQRDS